MQGPQSRTIKTTITMVNIVFHQLPFTQDRTKVQKRVFSFDIAFTRFFMSSKAADTLPDKSGIYTQHSTLIIAQFPPWVAVTMFKAIQFWITAFLICICSFKAWMALALSRRACFVKLVKASTLIIISVVPIEGTYKAAIYSCHWNTDLVHLAWFTRVCCRLGFMLPWAKANPSVQRPTQRTGNQGQRLGPQSH